jgi:integrase/recombinase XerD
MSTTAPSPAALTVIEPTFSETEKLALAGFLAGYSGMTRTLDLRQFTAWCRRRQLRGQTVLKDRVRELRPAAAEF